LRRFERYVAIGDSTVEGLDDPDGRGGYRGWANRLAERIARDQGGLLYANLAVRGRKSREVLEQQLEPALAMKPDLAIVVSGTNDILRPRFDAEETARDLEQMQRAFIESGATVVSFTLPDLTPVMPLARPLRARIRQFAAELVAAGQRSGARVIDFTAHPVASDPRLWSEDRLHANSLGHARIAEALAEALALPGTSREWAEALPALPPRGISASLAPELRWGRHYLLPWLWRHARGRSSGDGCRAKRPRLEPVTVDSASMNLNPRSRLAR
jgi:lysophospholipase L1-like esterase